MIELRYAQKVGSNPKAGPYTVLQYRYQYINETRNAWSDWQDVPTVWIGRSEPQNDGAKK